MILLRNLFLRSTFQTLLLMGHPTIRPFLALLPQARSQVKPQGARYLILGEPNDLKITGPAPQVQLREPRRIVMSVDCISRVVSLPLEGAQPDSIHNA
jgi:hypothetical protein